MSDSGKHSALRETGDGSFEIVFEDGLDEVSEDDPSFAEATADSDRAVPIRGSRRFITIATVSGVMFVLVAVGLWFAVAATDSTGDDVDEASAGFRPYGGGAEANAKGASSGAAEAARKRALAAARAEDDDEEEIVVIEEDEPGWELEEAEEDIVVVEEGEVDEVEEAAEIEEPLVDEGDGDIGLDPRTQIEPRQAPSLPSNLNMPVKPRVPNLGRAPIGRENLRNLPIRQIDPETGTLEEVVEEGEYVEESIGEEYLEESVDEEYLEEAVDEEYLEEPIEEY